MPRRYPAGGTYRGQYDFQQPTMSQYESFFNPVPIEFLQEQLRGRQQDYDVAYAGALASQDELAQQQVGMADIASKNEIIQKGMGNIDKVVEEKYGGDWSRAAKEVARHVTQIRANPFWNAQKEVEKKRTAFQEQVTKFGPQAMTFGADPRQLTTLDEMGQVRGLDQFTGEVVQQGDWGKTARDIFSTLTPEKIQLAGLSELEKGYLAAGEITRIPKAKLEKLAKDPDVQRAFQQSHPEFVRGFEEMDDTQKQRFGLSGDTLAEATEKTLYGNIAPAAFQQSERQILYDRQAEELRKAARNQTPQSVFGPSRETEATRTTFGTDAKEGRKQLRWNFNMEGSLLPGAGKLNEIEYNTVKGVVDNLRQENAALTKDMTDFEVYEDYLNDPSGQKYKMTIDKTAPILREDVQLNMGKSVAGNINGTEWYLESGDKVTNNWGEKGGLGQATGIPLETMSQLMLENEVPMGYNETKASYYLEIPVIDGDVAKNSDGTVNWNKTKTKGKKRVYYSPDTYTKGVTTLVQNLEAVIKSPEDREELLKLIPATVVFDESKLDEEGDVNTQEVFKMKNEDDEDEYYSLNELRRYYKMQSEAHAHYNYGEQKYED